MPIKKRKANKKQTNFNLGLILVGLALIVIIGTFSFLSKNSSTGTIQNEAQAGKNDPWYQYLITCTLNSASTDRISPVVAITSPVNGGTIPIGDGTANVKVSAIASDNESLYGGQTKAWLLVNGDVKDFSSNFGPISNDVPFNFYWGAWGKGIGKKYTFQVKMCDAAGNSAASQIVTTTTVGR